MGDFRHLRLALDVDLPSSELNRQANILPPPANRQRKLIVGNNHIHGTGAFVDNDPGNLCRGERAVHVTCRVRVPGHDIDPLAAKLLDDGLDSASLHAHAGTHGIHIVVLRGNSDLRAAARLPSRRLDGHYLLVHFGHFLLEELRQQFRSGSRQNDLRPLAHAVDLENIRTNPIARAVPLSGNLLLGRQDRLRPAEVDNQRALLEAAHNAVHHLALPVRIFVVGVVTLGIPQALDNDLLGRLGKNATKPRRIHLDTDSVADLSLGIVFRQGD